MEKICKNCSKKFTIRDADDVIYKKLGVPHPTFCPDCRAQRRTSFRNDWNVYNRKCDLCFKNIVSVYSPEKKVKVYCQECYWSDKWDGIEYGRDFDFTRLFFEQMAELISSVPLINLTISNCTNCEYNTNGVNSKDCYLSSRLGDSEGILYSYLPVKCLNCIDCFNVNGCQFCYECVDCWNCYNSMFCIRCKNTSGSSFCFECIGVKNCFGCVGLRNVEYYFFNQKCTKEEYEEKLQSIDISTFEKLDEMKKKFGLEVAKYPHRACVILNSENVSGDYISDSKNVFSSFDIEKSEDIANSWGVEFAKDVYDGCFVYIGENIYETIANFNSQNTRFCAFPYTCHDSYYLYSCFNNTGNCFGCVSLKQKNYCILNKQYSQEEYENLKRRIIEHMKSTGEWGEFFPASMSPFAYNETVAYEFFPMEKEEVISHGLKWKEFEKKTADAQNEDVLSCMQCERIFKLIPKELAFYKEKNLPNPKKCHICRHAERLSLRNPRRLWSRSCAKCNAAIQTSYSPDRPEIVYCEACYLAEVY